MSHAASSMRARRRYRDRFLVRETEPSSVLRFFPSLYAFAFREGKDGILERGLELREMLASEMLVPLPLPLTLIKLPVRENDIEIIVNARAQGRASFPRSREFEIPRKDMRISRWIKLNVFSSIVTTRRLECSFPARAKYF